MSILLSVTELLPDFSHSNWNVWNAKVVGDGSSWWCWSQQQQQQARVRRHKLPRNAHQGKNPGHGAKVEKPIGWIGFYDGLFYIQIGAWPSFTAHLTSQHHSQYSWELRGKMIPNWNWWMIFKYFAGTHCWVYGVHTQNNITSLRNPMCTPMQSYSVVLTQLNEESQRRWIFWDEKISELWHFREMTLLYIAGGDKTL